MQQFFQAALKKCLDEDYVFNILIYGHISDEIVN